MTDHFALLDEPRRPWLDPETLKAKFLARSAECHPDRVHTAAPEVQAAATARYTALNAAWTCLREPKDRLRHLLELESGRPPAEIQSLPADAMEMSMQIGQCCRSVDEFLSGRDKAVSPMLKVRSFQEGLQWTDRVQALQKSAMLRREELLGELRTLNVAWEAAPPPGHAGRAEQLPLSRLEQTYRLLSFTARWEGLLQERLVRLAM